MRFHILGLGPIGSLVAHNLRRYLSPEHGITLIFKNKEQALTRERCLRVENNGVVTKSSGFDMEVFNNSPLPVRKGRAPIVTPTPPVTSPAIANLTQTPEPIQSLIISAKAHQTVPAIRLLEPRLKPSSTIVLLQNGMGVYEELLNTVFRNPEQRPHIILASNTHGAYFFDGQRVIHAGIGALEFGIAPDYRGRNFEAALEAATPANPSPPLLIKDIAVEGDPEYPHYRSLRDTVAALKGLGALHTSWKPISAIQLAMRRKVVVNSVINPLTALMRCRNGEIFKSEAGQSICSSVAAEAAAAFAAQIKAETSVFLKEMANEGVDPTTIDTGRIPPSLTQESLEKEILRVASVTAGNQSSMLVDLERGRDTEIEYMNGYLTRLGQSYGVPMPVTSMLYNLVKMRTQIPLDQM
ncbi:hypothetical protein CC1G_01861 [Coprinopsis cinerea okayama7|uniref:2-dehydropantoate 2-reductase n=1 Tax=Coprinopsis cinerea (strain Okayama-7 / 130 / ATCC MYA-4618 / FGSC 9003) TaxID=240176 RepID=A8N2P7_COPC7|nr:hypothetical protein CC1G_01861 [Coprinopsis cinerea okayama7\|eukprot:XP_001829181.1 hypothetical protein CC1G_01861 [Coprinopsis cinerea okayama7\